jgi:hypothetical protein
VERERDVENEIKGNNVEEKLQGYKEINEMVLKFYFTNFFSRISKFVGIKLMCFIVPEKIKKLCAFSDNFLMTFILTTKFFQIHNFCKVCYDHKIYILN